MAVVSGLSLLPSLKIGTTILLLQELGVYASQPHTFLSATKNFPWILSAALSDSPVIKSGPGALESSTRPVASMTSYAISCVTSNGFSITEMFLGNLNVSRILEKL